MFDFINFGMKVEVVKGTVINNGSWRDSNKN